MLNMLKCKVKYALGSHAYPETRMATMGERIKTLRETRGLSQEELGKVIGVSGAAISGWENGSIQNPKQGPFLKMCAYFGVDPYRVVFAPEDDPRNAFSRARR